MAKRKNAPKNNQIHQESTFMDELENTADDVKTEGSNYDDDVDNDEQRGEGEETEQLSSPEQSVKSKKGLSSVSMSLKRVRKTVENLDLNDLSIADKFDLRMASSYIDFLKETIDNMLNKLTRM